jgi:hypothetical protein
MLIEKSPIYDALVGELGNPVPATPIDCTYATVLALAEAEPGAEPVSLPVPGTRSAAKPFAPKQMAAS